MIPVLIIPVLNRYDLLDETINSIDYEIKNILIINNGLEKYVSPRNDLPIHILDMPSNQGISGSWNLGIKCYPHEPYWLIGSSDTSYLPGSLEKFAQYSGPNVFVKSIGQSGGGWHTFSVGEQIVKTVGLFDEYLYPAYFEDNDYERRMLMAGFENNIIDPGIEVNDNDGSQTIKSDSNFMNKNNDTFYRNRKYYESKFLASMPITLGWDLERRRDNEWL